MNHFSVPSGRKISFSDQSKGKHLAVEKSQEEKDSEASDGVTFSFVTDDFSHEVRERSERA